MNERLAKMSNQGVFQHLPLQECITSTGNPRLRCALKFEKYCLGGLKNIIYTGYETLFRPDTT